VALPEVAKAEGRATEFEAVNMREADRSHGAVRGRTLKGPLAIGTGGGVATP